MGTDVSFGREFEDGGLLFSGGEVNGVSECCDISDFNEESCITTFACGGGIGIAPLEVSLFGLSSGFRRDSSVVEIWSGEEIGVSGDMVVRELIGATGVAGWLMRGCSGPLS